MDQLSRNLASETDPETVKAQLIAELAAARSDLSQSKEALHNRARAITNLPNRIQTSFNTSIRQHPGIWMAVASTFGFLISRRLFFSKRRIQTPKSKSTWQKLPKLLFSLILMISKPALMRLASQYIESRFLADKTSNQPPKLP